MNYLVNKDGSYKVTAQYRRIHEQTLAEGKAKSQEDAIVICETIISTLINNDRFTRQST